MSQLMRMHRQRGMTIPTMRNRHRFSFLRAMRLELLEARWLLASDFGDAPIPYPTLLAEDGPRHEDLGPILGSVRDTEPDGLHSLLADGDDNAGVPDDEDGVSFGPVYVGQLGASVTVTVSNAPSGARLDAWLDFNGDGSWGGPLEQIADNVLVVNGSNVLTFDVPSTAADGTAFARFRLSTAGNLGVRGVALDGEVEDHTVTISPPAVATGVFGNPNTISTTADGANSVFAADVDGDGDTDVLFASRDDDTIAWYENNGSQVFTQRIISTTADGANSVFAADVDGDGDTDVLSASQNDDKIAWYENNGSQGFTQRVISTTADAAWSVFAADVDGDGDTDVLSASRNDDKIAWYENNGSQVFTQRVISTTANGANSVFAADVDGDGDTDVLSASDVDDKIAWYENNGSQSFTERIISTNADDAFSVFAADVDGDGDTDVLSASYSDDKIAWYENNGSQVFTQRIISTTADVARSVFAADVDGDGDTDVLSAAGRDGIAWYENNGSQVFTERVISTAAYGARSVFAADVDGDGDTDVFAASSDDDTIAWYENLVDIPEIDVRGNGVSIVDGDTTPGLADHTDFGVAVTIGGAVSHTFTIANTGGRSLNLTGVPIVVVSGVHASDFTISVQPSSPVAPGTGTTTFSVVFDPSVSGTRSATISIANDDADENPYDFAITGVAIDLAEFGDAPLPYPTTIAENGAGHDAVGPILGIHRDTETNGVHSLLADGDDNAGVPDDEDGVSFGPVYVGQLGASVTVTVSNAPSGARLDAWLDFNGDGSWGGPLEQIADGVLVSNGSNVLTFDVPSTAADGTAIARFRLSTAANLGVRGVALDGEVEDHTVSISPPAAASGVFGNPNTISTNADGAREVFAADVDGDGDTDVLSASQNDDKIAWYENNGSQVFTERIISNNADRAVSVFAADVDGDGDIDVLAASSLDSTIAWYENNGSHGFTQRIISTLASSVESVFAADVDGDGDTDVLSASWIGENIAWYENNGSQVFTRRVIPTANDGALSVFAADVDGDGDTDVLSASGRNDKIAWYENDGSQVFTQRIISTTANAANSVFAADVDGDGDTDVLSSSADDTIAWYENNGSQVFTQRIISTTADGARSVFALDVDGDGDIDVLSASRNDDKIAWYENNGSQVFTERIISATADGAYFVFAADVDGDGDTDVLSASFNDDKIAWYENLNPLDGDFNDDGVYNCLDINALTTAVATGGSVALYDLNGDHVLSLADVDAWRAEAGEVNLGPGRVYLVGDANLDSLVDGQDFIAWNANKFTNNTNWCSGNFNADSVVDGQDFILWNANKFTSADAVVLVNTAMPTTGLVAAASKRVVSTGNCQLDMVRESGSVLAEVPPRSRAVQAIDGAWRAAESWWRSRWTARPDKTIGTLRWDFSDEFQDAVDAIMVHWNGV